MEKTWQQAKISMAWQQQQHRRNISSRKAAAAQAAKIVAKTAYQYQKRRHQWHQNNQRGKWRQNNGKTIMAAASAYQKTVIINNGEAAEKHNQPAGGSVNRNIRKVKAKISDKMASNNGSSMAWQHAVAGSIVCSAKRSISKSISVAA